MLTDDEINRCFESVMFDPNSDPSREAIGRAILAAHTAKLLAEVEMPEPVAYSHECELDYIANGGRTGEILPFKHNPDLLDDDEFIRIYTADQLQQYAAACAVKAREKALDEAKGVCHNLGLSQEISQAADVCWDCAAAIESLKGKQA